MSDILTFSLTVFTGFFAIMNPIANGPIFLGLVEGMEIEEKKSTAKKATVTAFVIVTVFVIAGKYIFDLFGITIPAFKITGGILIFYVGFEMLMSQKSRVHNTRGPKTASQVAISPLSIPILAGPGTLVTAMNYVTDASLYHVGMVLLIFALMVYLNYLAFILSDKLIEKLGHHLIDVIGKIMGLILAIMGTDMVIAGIKLAFDL